MLITTSTCKELCINEAPMVLRTLSWYLTRLQVLYIASLGTNYKQITSHCLKNHFGQFHKLNNDNSQLHTTRYGLSNLCTVLFLLPRSYTILLYCKYAILNLCNSYISLKYFS